MKGRNGRDSYEESGGSGQGLDMLLRQLKGELDLDLKQYKPNYLKRRIGVRMRATECSDYTQYRSYIRRDPAESRRLVNDLTINVTEFFRDQDVYREIDEKIIPEILKYKKNNRIQSLRAWSAGCASGEEPYSLSALFVKALKKEGGPERWTVRVTATDLDDKALQKAKAGRYDEVKMLPGMATGDYFNEEEGQYTIREEIRRPVRFLVLDLVKQPPLRYLDLVLCRNVLIYFERDQQRRILDIFNRCLRKGGFLVLGKSEAILGAGESGFIPFLRRERIYTKEYAAQEGVHYKRKDHGSKA